MTLKLYKAADVCEATGLQAYVLRSWEKEFPGIGVQKSQESPRLYRQSDVEQVLRIKQLVFGEGLTLAGARRRLEEAAPRRAYAAEPQGEDVLDTLGADARSRIAFVRSGLRTILDLLSRSPGAGPLDDVRAAVTTTERDLRPRGSSGASKGPNRRRARSTSQRKPAKRTAATAAKRGATTRKGRRTQRF
jgi:DNA-binding transcriptional MerR regulator